MDKISLEDFRKISDYRYKEASEICCLDNTDGYVKCMDKGKNIVYVCDQTTTISLIATKKSAPAFKYVFDFNMTSEVITEAIKKDPMNLQYIPTELRSFEVCLDAIKLNPKTIPYIPSTLRKEEIAIEAVRGSADNLMFMPRRFQTPDVVLEALKKDKTVVQYVDSNSFQHLEDFIKGDYSMEIAIEKFNEAIRKEDDEKLKLIAEKQKIKTERKNKQPSRFTKAREEFERRNKRGHNAKTHKQENLNERKSD